MPRRSRFLILAAGTIVAAVMLAPSRAQACGEWELAESTTGKTARFTVNSVLVGSYSIDIALLPPVKHGDDVAWRGR